MSPDPQSILEAALQLPEGERLALVAQLLDSLPPGQVGLSVDDPQLVAELNRRCADSEGTIPWGELKAEG
jgi:putative addiction module component (TIGR02574 family)